MDNRDKLNQSDHSTSVNKKPSDSSLNESGRRSGSGSMESGSGRSSGSSGVNSGSSNKNSSNSGSSDIGTSGDIGRGSQGSSRQ